MTEIILRLRRQPYLGLALASLTLMALALLIGLQQSAIPDTWRFWWQVVTGTLLTGVIGYQWMLLYYRLSGANAATQRKYYTNHRWVGSVSFLLFAFHAISIGHMLTNLLALLFLACGITGILNREIIRYRANWAYNLWFALHLAFSALLAPLILAHIWIALLYEGI